MWWGKPRVNALQHSVLASQQMERTWLGSHSGRLPTQAKQLGGIENEFENKIDHTVFLGKQPVTRVFSCRRRKNPPRSLNLKLQRPGCYLSCGTSQK